MDTPDRGPRGLALGRVFFGAAVAASGVLQLVTGEYVRLVPRLPGELPSTSPGAYALGLVLVAIGLAVLTGRMARTALAVLTLLLVVNLLFVYLPQMIWNPVVDRPFLRGFMWTNPLKSMALVGGAAMLAARLDGVWSRSRPLVRALDRLEPAGPLFLAIFLIVAGIQHFWYRPFVTRLIPAYIPAPVFWTYFTAVALLAGGVGILWPRTTRLAANMAGLMVFLWVPMLHIPRAISGPAHGNETAGIFEALALSGVALVVAATHGRSASTD
jgi:uncharacterized membrane protein YphA (DoxX/SURF4 family)